MPEMGTLHDAFIDELKDMYDAEKQLTKALPKLAKASTNPKLRQAFESHLQETQGHVERLERVFESIDEKPKGKHCDGIAGIIEEGKSVMEEDFDEVTMDACLIASGQRAEHYEIAGLRNADRLGGGHGTRRGCRASPREPGGRESCRREAFGLGRRRHQSDCGGKGSLRRGGRRRADGGGSERQSKERVLDQGRAPLVRLGRAEALALSAGSAGFRLR
jgi:ferritin-like metal-binding protein YciE